MHRVSQPAQQNEMKPNKQKGNPCKILTSIKCYHLEILREDPQSCTHAQCSNVTPHDVTADL